MSTGRTVASTSSASACWRANAVSTDPMPGTLTTLQQPLPFARGASAAADGLGRLECIGEPAVSGTLDQLPEAAATDMDEAGMIAALDV
jgi:hypothetical protein